MCDHATVDDPTQGNQPCPVLIIERGYNISQAACEILHPRTVFRKRPAKYYTLDTIFRGCRISRYTCSSVKFPFPLFLCINDTIPIPSQHVVDILYLTLSNYCMKPAYILMNAHEQILYICCICLYRGWMTWLCCFIDGGGDTHLGYGILGGKKSGLWDMRAKKSGMWDMGKSSGIWDIRVEIINF